MFRFMLGQLCFVFAMILASFTASYAQAESHAPLKIVVSIKPIESLVKAIGGDLVETELLIDGAMSPHQFRLKPSQVRVLSGADLSVWVGPNLEVSLADAFKMAGSSSKVLELMDLDGLKTYDLRDGFEPDDHEGHGDEDDHGMQLDPHIWLDVDNAILISDAIRALLTQLAPHHAGVFQDAFDAQKARLSALNAEISEVLSAPQGQKFIVFHDAYQYFERQYGLSAANAVSSQHGSEPGMKHVKLLQIMIGQGEVGCVFIEPQFSPRLAEMLAKGKRVRTVMLDPQGAGLPSGAGQYPALMQAMSAAFADCI